VSNANENFWRVKKNTVEGGVKKIIFIFGGRCLVNIFVHIWQVLEMVSEEYGGRVELAKAYYKALTDSVRKHFKGNGVISSMQQCNDFMFLGTQTISLGRVGRFLKSTYNKIN
jgi:hypothetical protein